MNIQQLQEALTDISTENKLFHYTNINSLISILRHGFLKGFSYPANTTNNKKPEIATIRKAAITDKKVFDNLSSSVGSAQFTLYVDRIKASVRNATVKPIAENPEGTKIRMRKILGKIFDEPDKVLRYIEKHYLDLKKDENFITFKKMFNCKDNIKEENKLFTAIYEYSANMELRREAEERIGVNQIDLDKNLMKIRIMPSFKNDWVLFLPGTFIFGDRAKEAEKIFKNNRELFTQDKTFNRLLETLNKLSNMSVFEACKFLELSKEETSDVFFNFKVKV